MLLLSLCRSFFLSRSLSLSKLKHSDCLSAAEVRGQATSWTWVCKMDGAGTAAGASYIARRQPQTLSIKQVTVLRIIHSPLCWSGQGNGVLQLILACNYLLLKTVGLLLFTCMCMPEKTPKTCVIHSCARHRYGVLRNRISNGFAFHSTQRKKSANLFGC